MSDSDDSDDGRGTKRAHDDESDDDVAAVSKNTLILCFLERGCESVPKVCGNAMMVAVFCTRFKFLVWAFCRLVCENTQLHCTIRLQVCNKAPDCFRSHTAHNNPQAYVGLVWHAWLTNFGGVLGVCDGGLREQ
jgi:hypothetical protein